ncbi:MAG TPA: bifunctional phosphoribosyl-AMP cyclohydrolase/phosphoribosyl-ATP diphosphatase HisIE [Saprospiraceae bacterium]|nr:bifunctional phosphoribosyl-AMP cyclohydrolase/phosphoribosyl-ATP diphosphatase HisIE [Saprospiraceae bacterium]HQU55280.1 bifunctional phosphoribosyl-AMP cyclohydrolase/phosphoribosyl-ATP diphosphatase HisIE [Saprospiraceae bacterium]
MRMLNQATIEKLDFAKGDGLIPVIIQDNQSEAVLMLGYMDKEALQQTLATKMVTFYSRSKDRLWTKGETSGNFLHLKSVQVDCDNDTLLMRVKPDGPVCHTGDDTCFGDINERKFFLHKLGKIIRQRKEEGDPTSYTNKLLNRGINKIAQKVGEEAVELVIEAKDSNRRLFVGEAADLLYHFMVLLEAKEIRLKEIEQELERRHLVKTKGRP